MLCSRETAGIAGLAEQFPALALVARKAVDAGSHAPTVKGHLLNASVRWGAAAFP
jgi:hypothetical protein